MDDKKLIVERWLIKAQRDLRSASRLMQNDDEIDTDIICFHCQQCAEKCLKAFLVLAEQNFPKTHDLLLLLHLCIPFDPSFDQLEEWLIQLNDYAVEVRYPDDWVEISLEEAKQSVIHAQLIKEFIEPKINEKFQKNNDIET